MSDQETSPLVVGFVSDLMFTSKIANVIRHLDYRVEWIEESPDVGPADPDAPQESPGELLHGQGGRLFEKITEWQPALLLFDLTNEAIPWQRWIPKLKSSPATRRIPIICFGPHKDVEQIQEAKRVGADLVLARSRFTADMPDLLQKHARLGDDNAMLAACRQPLADLARRGIEMFNDGHYYKCHDDLEEAWMEDESPGRNLYRGILQVGIALYQVERGNYRGAVKMLLRVRQWLNSLPDVCREVNVAKLRENTTLIHEHVTDLGSERLDEFNWEIVEEVEII